MNVEPHVVREIAPGVHWARLDFPSIEIVRELIDEQVPHVLCWGGHLGCYRWEPFLLPVAEPLSPEPVLARAVEVDFIVDTSCFLSLLPEFRSSISIVQLRRVPPDHLDMRRIQGKELWRLLSEVGWHVWCNVPGNDHAQVASPHRAVVERAVKWTEEAS